MYIHMGVMLRMLMSQWWYGTVAYSSGWRIETAVLGGKEDLEKMRQWRGV